jgi:PEGA domain
VRRTALCVLLTGAAFSAACSRSSLRPRSSSSRLNEDEGVELRGSPNVAAARALDRQGVLEFRDGHFADALLYFRAARRLGGPSSELWNAARTREKLDDPEGAAAVIDEYLAQRDLSPEDRAEAEREARGLRQRSSDLTITTNPVGAQVTIDGKTAAGTTPLSVEVGPGPHVVTIQRPGFVTETRAIEGRYGKAIVVSLDLRRAGK